MSIPILFSGKNILKKKNVVVCVQYFLSSEHILQIDFFFFFFFQKIGFGISCKHYLPIFWKTKKMFQNATCWNIHPEYYVLTCLQLLASRRLQA